MRVLVVEPGPAYSVADVQRGWQRAFRELGHQVVTYNLGDRLSFFATAKVGDRTFTRDESVALALEPLGDLCYRYWPHLIVVVSGFYIVGDLWDVWRDRGHTTVLLCTESPYEDDKQIALCEKAQPDVVVLNDPTNIDRYAGLAKHVEYIPHAYDPAIHKPGPSLPDFECDFAFAGTGYPSRSEMFARVDWRGIDVKLAGHWEASAGTVLERFVIHPIRECYDNEKVVDLYRSCRASANLYRKEANDPSLSEGWAMGPREVELAACETFFLREPRGEGDELFPFLPTFTEPGEFGELLRWYFDHDDVRQACAERAAAAVSDRTFQGNARRLLALIE
jgi:hypothetical protein